MVEGALGGLPCNLKEMKDSAVLLIDCPDRKGLVARLPGLLYERGAIFFMPINTRTTSWGCFSCAWSGRWTAMADVYGRRRFDLDGFKAAFAPLAAELGMRWKLTAGARRPRMALFCSQYLHCMADLLHRWRTGELDCEIPVIVSNT